MRGLKLVSLALLELVDAVASFTDAWIETGSNNGTLLIYKSHLLQMRGLKPGSAIADTPVASRIFYRCVD